MSTERASQDNETIWVIDDEPEVAKMVVRLLTRGGFAAEALGTAEEALERLAEPPLPAAIFVDLHMPGMDGRAVLERARPLAPDVPFVLMTGRGSIEVAVEAMKGGAFDFLTKPFESAELVVASCQRAVAHTRLLRQNRDLKRRLHHDEQNALVGSDSSMKKLRQLIAAVAPTDATVLIVGETGTGKEVVARAVHDQSGRAQGPFVPVNCGALNEALLESELFGNVRGAFTGATTSRRGLVEASSGGTLFLDEVGELSMGMQTRLLRVLQEGEIRPVGADTRRLVDVRIVAATHRNLQEAVAKGTFREDLYYRLNVFRMAVQPLRERRQDIPAFVVHFLSKLSLRLGRAQPAVEPQAVAALCERPWPGNLRELENTLERAIILTKDVITRELIEAVSDLEDGATPSSKSSKALKASQPAALPELPFNDARMRFERRYLQGLLEQVGGNRAEVARRAQLDPSNLRRLLKRHGLD